MLSFATRCPRHVRAARPSATRAILVLAAVVFVSACAPKIVPTPIVTAPKFPEFTQPPIPAAQANSPAAVLMSRGWAFLQSGDLRTAEHEIGAALKAQPSFYPAETS